MMRCITLAILAIVLCTNSAFAEKKKMPKAPKEPKEVKIRMSIDNRMELKIEGDGNQTTLTVSADNSQNVEYHYTDSRQWHDSHDVTTTTTDARQWHTATTTTDSRQWHNPTTVQPNYAPRVAVQPYYIVNAPIEPFCTPAQLPRLTYEMVVDECVDKIHIRCWAACGGYFVDSEGRRFNLLPSYSKVPLASRHKALTGRYWRSSAGVLYFTAIWPCGTIRTFIDP